MGLVVLFLLALIVAGAIVYPLLPGRTPPQPAPAVTDGDIQRAVRNLRRARSGDSLSCRTCGESYQAGDRFCVRCGGELPHVERDSVGPVCPSCGAALHEADQFCAKCGQSIVVGEGA